MRVALALHEPLILPFEVNVPPEVNVSAVAWALPKTILLTVTEVAMAG